jgi:hypothetical protein
MDEDEENTNEVSEEVAKQGYGEDVEDMQEHMVEVQQDQQFGSYPGQTSREGIFTFFRHILGIKDSSKVANLRTKELGMLDLSVRNCEYLAKLGKLLHNDSYDTFFMTKAEITLATSMSRGGWLPELVVSQKRYSQRMVQPTTPVQQKKTFFGKPASQQPAQAQ